MGKKSSHATVPITRNIRHNRTSEFRQILFMSRQVGNQNPVKWQGWAEKFMNLTVLIAWHSPFNRSLVQDKPDVNEDESYFFRVTEAIFVGWFTLEYIIRFLVAPDKVKKTVQCLQIVNRKYYIKGTGSPDDFIFCRPIIFKHTLCGF